ncbi:MAG TPA: hypothetical protein VGB83_09510 [Actinomycetota bacterium]
MTARLDAGPLTAGFVGQALSRGVRPPLRLVGEDARAWQVGAADGDALLVDEYGDAWWGRVQKASFATVIRPCWPEERALVARAVRDALATLASRPS